MASEEGRESIDLGSHSTAVRAAVAAAATGAAAYGVRRLRSSHEEADEDSGPAPEEKTDEGADGDGVSAKREELTQALSTKVDDVKKAASKLKPSRSGGSSLMGSAWEAASDHVLPVAEEAAASLGAMVATKAPQIIRDDLMPHFIEGFEKAQ